HLEIPAPSVLLLFAFQVQTLQYRENHKTDISRALEWNIHSNGKLNFHLYEKSTIHHNAGIQWTFHKNDKKQILNIPSDLKTRGFVLFFPNVLRSSLLIVC